MRSQNNQKKNKPNLEINDYNHSNLFEVDSIKGFAMFLNMSKFTDINFFDENFFLYLEEIDICKRIKIKNEKF